MSDKRNRKYRFRIMLMYGLTCLGLFIVLIEIILLLLSARISGTEEKGSAKQSLGERIENLILLHFDLPGEEEDKPQTELPTSPILTLEEDTTIRVVIKTSDYSSIYHDNLDLSCRVDWNLFYGEQEKRSCKAGAGLSLTADSEWFQKGSRIRIEPKEQGQNLCLSSVSRHYGAPVYRGALEIWKTDRGLVLINELLFEEYLYGIVPSEMPSSYPLEALKAQAISARTYAYRFLLYPGYPEYEAHLDDSTTYQVYNNITEQDSTTKAVQETRGQVLFTETGELAESYYYSTSCGIGADGDIWGNENYPSYLGAKLLNETVMEAYLEEEASPLLAGYEADFSQGEAFAAFITQKQTSDFEDQESWYRWTYQVEKIDVEQLWEQLLACSKKSKWNVQILKNGQFTTGTPQQFTCLQRMVISERGRGGNVQAMLLYTDTGVYQVQGGQNIRTLLLNSSDRFQLVDGSYTTLSNMLPSSFFVLETGKVNGNVIGYTIVGGGLGHGVGMSQNAAKNMAYAGYTAQEILSYFYNDCLIYAGG